MKSKLYHKFKQKMQDNLGFTMAEVLTVVAILSILMAITFVAIFHYYQTLKLNEMDGTAKEIYIAAQNHLSYAKSTGKLDEIIKAADRDQKRWRSHFGYEMTQKPSDWEADSKLSKEEKENNWKAEQNKGNNNYDNYRYLVVNNLNTGNNERKSIFNALLPSGSIDETVRSGHYIIEYNITTAKVYGVFYSEDVNFENEDEQNDSNKDKRSLNKTGIDTRVRPVNDNNGHKGRINYGKHSNIVKGGIVAGIIGYYGGSNTKLPTGKVLDNISLTLKNDNKLTAEINVPGYFNKEINKDDVNYQYELHVRGKTSSVTRTFLLQLDEKNTTNGINLSLDNKQKSYNLYHDITAIKTGGEDNNNLIIDFYLDDITKPGTHFSELGRGWIPGEDITAWVDVSGESAITGIKRVSAKDSVNSLFSYVKVDNEKNTAEVGIANFRNLENLDKQVSNLGMKSKTADSNNEEIKKADYSNYLSGNKDAKARGITYDITSAVQTENLDWDNDEDDKEHPKSFVRWIRKSDDYIEKNLENNQTISDDVHVVDYDYMDVMSDGEKTTNKVGDDYNQTGNNQYRSINLTKDASIKKKYGNEEKDETYTSALKLYDGGNKEIKNLAITGENEIKENNNSPTSENHPAGLFGTVDLNGDFAVKNLTLVDTNIAAQSTAGALIGKSDNTTLTVENVSAQSKNKSIESSNAVAGGLIGAVNSNNINVHDSFSTMIVKGKTYAGGLIGEAHGNGNISNSYVGGHTDNGKYSTTNYNITATGDNGIAAGFIASADNQLEIQNCYSTASAKGKSKAYAFTNRNLPDSCYAVGKYQVGNDEVKQDTVDEKFVVNDSTARTYHYDDSIKENYPYKTVTTGKVDNDIYDHVGDWEAKKEDDKIFSGWLPVYAYRDKEEGSNNYQYAFLEAKFDKNKIIDSKVVFGNSNNTDANHVFKTDADGKNIDNNSPEYGILYTKGFSALKYTQWGGNYNPDQHNNLDRVNIEVNGKKQSFYFDPTFKSNNAGQVTDWNLFSINETPIKISVNTLFAAAMQVQVPNEKDTLGNSEDTPYYVRTKSQFSFVAWGASGYFQQLHDIDYENQRYGFDANDGKFSGHYDGLQEEVDSNGELKDKSVGNNYEIANANIQTNQSGTSGIFPLVEEGASVKNLEVHNATLNNQQSSGILIGRNQGTIDHCLVYNDSGHYENAITFSGWDQLAGGFVGTNEGGTITNSSACVNVYSSSKHRNYVGGFVGKSTGGVISDCYVGGNNLYSNNIYGQYAGGFVGYVNGSTVFNNCYTTASVSSLNLQDEQDWNKNTQSTGGFVGYDDSSSSYINSYAANIIADNEFTLTNDLVGGFAGYAPKITGNGNYYLKTATINENITDAFGNNSNNPNTDVAKPDDGKLFGFTTNLAKAQPYTSSLGTSYPFRSVVTFNGIGHYGDWPIAN